MKQTNSINLINPIKSKTVLITAGPTREYLDPIRFISNPSSGKLGFELAKEFSKSGYKVILVSGPTKLPPLPKKIKVYYVETSDEMFNKIKKHFFSCNIFIATSAVTDFKPIKKAENKIKKSKHLTTIKLIPTVDILKYCGENKKNGQVIIGFALETNNKIRNAIKKLNEKNLDFIVLNSPETFNNDYIKPTIIYKNKKVVKYNKISKKMFAKKLRELLCVAREKIY